MAQVKWTDEADALFDKYIMNAFVEYGRKTSLRWLNERIKMTDKSCFQTEIYVFAVIRLWAVLNSYIITMRKQIRYLLLISGT